jgi:nitrilase
MTGPILAAVQASPICYDRQASTEKACHLIAEAASLGADLIVFGETWVPGYPIHMNGVMEIDFWKVSSRYLDAAIAIPGPETKQLCEAAKLSGADVIIGVVELEPRTQGTVYATMLTISKDGMILGTHRKLMPTRTERVVWGQGQGDDLDVYQRDYGRISALNCWEHQMMLPGFALMAKGTQFHAASWPRGDPDPLPDLPVASWPRMEILSRAFAVQGACYVISASVNMAQDDIPDDLKSLASPWIGESMIVDPRGEIVARSERGAECIITAKADLDLIRAAKSVNDIAGHYARPDVFDLRVKGRSVFE